MFWCGANIGRWDSNIGMNMFRDTDRRWYVFLRCLCLTQVWIGSFMAFKDHPNMTCPHWHKIIRRPMTPFHNGHVAEVNEMMKQQACWLPGSFWIVLGDSCDDERKAERNSWKLKIIHDLSRKIINQTSILGILVNQTKGIAIGELINPNLRIFLKVWFEFRRYEIFITCIFFDLIKNTWLSFKITWEFKGSLLALFFKFNGFLF